MKITHILLAVAVAVTLPMVAPRSQAAVPGLVYTTAITQDVNVTSSMALLPLSVLGISPFTQAVGTPPNLLRFTTAGSYKIVAQYLIQSDLATYWAFNIEWDLATPGTYLLPVVTTPMSFVAGVLPNTYIATVTVDSLYVNVGDSIGFAASVRAQNPNTPYVIKPKVLQGLAGTTLQVNTP